MWLAGKNIFGRAIRAGRHVSWPQPREREMLAVDDRERSPSSEALMLRGTRRNLRRFAQSPLILNTPGTPRALTSQTNGCTEDGECQTRPAPYVTEPRWHYDFRDRDFHARYARRAYIRAIDRAHTPGNARRIIPLPKRIRREMIVKPSLWQWPAISC